MRELIGTMRILDTTARLDAAEYRADHGASFGSVHDTLVHIMGAQWLWLSRWQGTSPRALPSPEAFADLAAVRRRWAEVDRDTRAFVATVTGPAALDRVVEYVNTEGERSGQPRHPASERGGDDPDAVRAFTRVAGLPLLYGREDRPLMPVVGVDHVQLAMPAGREAEARAFYAGLLGIPEIPKPPVLAARGGAWFESGRLKIHLGVDHDFRPARKAHAGLLVRDLDALIAELRRAGHAVVDDEPLAGYLRVYVNDPFGNRLELMEPQPSPMRRRASRRAR